MIVDKPSEHALEFEKVKNIAAGFALSPAGAGKLLALEPSDTREEILFRQKLVGELLEIVKSKTSFPLQRFDDLAPLFPKLGIEGIILTPMELWEVANFVSLVNRLVSVRKDLEERFSGLADFLSPLQADKIFPEACFKALEPSGEVKDGATALLKSLRQKIRSSKNKIEEKLWNILARKGLVGKPEGYVTLREGRYVIPFGEKDPDLKKAIVHDRSASGATFFVEPMATVELNNELKEAELAEAEEVKRILSNLSALVVERHDKLEKEFEILARLDCFWGLANIGNRMEGVLPQLSDDELVLKGARHPLLLFPRGEYDPTGVVPCDLALAQTNRVLLISGPNAGGKTVTLKLVGLTALMFQSGFPLPAKEGTKLPIFNKIFATIGDEQSIELSLSSFSAHLVRLKESLKVLTPDSLLLFDELLSGTDPKEGAVLAEAFLAHLHATGAKVVVTTHYSSLKTLPEVYPAMQNASLDFDTQNLRPTYRLRVGIPGASFAIELASRIGLPESLVAEAQSKVGTSERELSNLLVRLAEKERLLEQKSVELQRLEQKLSSEAQVLHLEREEFKQFEKEKRKKALEEAAQFVRQAKREIEELLDAAKKQAKEKAALEQVRRELTARGGEIEREQESLREKLVFSGQPLEPGQPVFVPFFNAKGKLMALDGSEATVEIEGKTYKTKTENLKALALEPAQKVPATLSGTIFEPATSVEIDLRGFSGDEAVQEVDKFLDRALLSDYPFVLLIHGKGTGALKKRIGEFLKTHPAVVDYRPGEMGEGGEGVTVVTLKK
ncbi:MAG: endonuclease MutS2 [candidate division Zixibacteria bacterium]|nr:endonuclease MutS2 [candidate division Zixibacteria bacterium]